MAEKEPVVEVVKKKSEFHVYNPNGLRLVRTYTIREHGDRAEDLAKMFAKKNNYAVVSK
jgi:hypothetical protein